MKEFHIPDDRDTLMRRIGDLSQVAGVRRFELTDGKAKGIEAADVRTGTGFRFTVLPGRGMDIAWTEYRGVPVGYISKAGIAGPAYYESEGLEWLRCFFGGLLTTCGLMNAGGPSAETHPIVGLRRHGLHGRISCMAADQVSAGERWEPDGLRMWVSGRLRESMPHCENLTLHRTVSARMGESRLFIRDEVCNEGYSRQEYMLLYHVNIGYPLLDEGSRLVLPSKSLEPADALSGERRAEYAAMGLPSPGARENLYFHTLRAGADGMTMAGLLNDSLEAGVYLRYSRDALPYFTQWKMMGAPEYVLGLEPGNCLPVGRERQSRNGGLAALEPGESAVFELEIGILEDRRRMNEFEAAAACLGK